MSVISVNWKAIDKTFRALCRRWVNPAVKDASEAGFQADLLAFLFALPPLTLATTFLAAVDGSPQSGALAAFSISLPVLASSWLSLSGSPLVRNLIIVAGGPMLALATAASGTAMSAAAAIAFATGVVWACQRKPNWKIWLACGFSALGTAMALLFLRPATVTPFAYFAALPVVLLASYIANRQKEAQPVALATDSLARRNSELTALADHVGAILFQVARSGIVSGSEGRSAVNWLSPTALEGRGLIDKLHLADRPGFLAWIGGLTSNRTDDEFEARLINTGSVEAAGWATCQFKKIREDDAGLLLSLVVESWEDPAENGTDAVAVGSLGHELRTPLNAVVGFSELLRDGFYGPLANEKQAEYLNLIHKSSRHLVQVSNAMLDWSQLESQTRQLNAETFIPADAAALAIGIVSADARAKRIGLEFNPACGFEEFCGDKRALTQILVNLFSNAIKFAPFGGHVNLAIDIEKDCLKLSVSDNGPGIDAVDRDRIGVPFMQSPTSDSAQAAGIGLGLSIVRQLAKLHGGSMQVESAPGEGTCVTVALPELRQRRANISELRPSKPDESIRDIQIFGEQGHAKNRKTA